MPGGREGIRRGGEGVVDGGETGGCGMRETWNAFVEERESLLIRSAVNICFHLFCN